MDLENIMLSEMSDNERQILYAIIYTWNLKNNTNECICETETDSDTENKPVITKGEREGRGTN